MVIISIFEFIEGRERDPGSDTHPAIFDVVSPTTNSPFMTDIYDKSKTKTFCRSMYYTSGGLVQRDVQLQPRTVFSRFQTILVGLISVVLIALFTSNMVQYFTVEREKHWIQSIEELKMCGKIECNRIGIVERSQHADFFKKEVTNGIEVNYHHLKHPEESYRQLLDYDIDITIVDSSSADYLTQTKYCDLEATGLPFGRTEFGIAVPKKWPYKDDLDKNIIYLKESSAIDNLLAKWFQQKNCDRTNEATNNGFGDGLTLEQTRGLFIVFIVLTSINILFFILKQTGFFYAIQQQISKWFSTSSSDQGHIEDDSGKNDRSNDNQSAQQTSDESVQSLPVGIKE